MKSKKIAETAQCMGESINLIQKSYHQHYKFHKKCYTKIANTSYLYA